MATGSNRVRLIAYAVTALWSALVLIAGVQLDDTWKQVASGIPILVVAGVGLFDNYLWRVQPFCRLANRPDLIGTWRGTLVSMRDGEDGQEVTHDPVPIFLVIRQAYLRLSISLLSAESRSRSIVAMIQTDDDREYTVYYHYANTPGLEVRSAGASHRHSGGATVSVNGLRPEALGGEYWTDRRTRGTYEARRMDRKHHSSWAEAVAASNEKGA